VPLEAERGTLVLLNGTLPHLSGPNTSDKPRHAYTIHAIDSHANYPADNWLQRPSLVMAGFND
jgi:phytanoyl-CoA hydroxylase